MADSVVTVGAGSIATELPAGQKGPTDNNNNPVTPRVTDDFTGPPPSNSIFTSIAYAQYGPFSGVMNTDPLGVQTEAHGLDIGYSPTPIVTDTDYHYPYFADLTVGLAGLNADGTKLAGYSDWTATADWDGQMRATFGEGLPFVYVTKQSGADAVVDLHEQTLSSKDTPINPLTYTLNGLTGSFDGSALKFNLPLDAGSDVADGAQIRVSYDFDGDGKVDRTETYNWFATDAAPGEENYTEAQGLVKASGSAMADMKGGSIKVEIWKANGSGDVSVVTNSATSFVDVPYSSLTTAAGQTISGPLYLQGGATAGGMTSTLVGTPGDTPSSDTTHMDKAPSIGGYTGPGTVWYNQNGVVGITINGKNYGIFGPTGSTWTYTDAGLESNLDGKDYYSVAVLPDNSVDTLMMFRQHAYAFVTDTTSSYTVDQQAGTLTTVFTAVTKMMETGSDLSSDPLMALYRHQYINSDAPLTDISYASARGEIKLLAGGSSFSTTMPLTQLLPILPFVGTDEQKANLQSMLHDELKNFLSQDNNPLQGDTYWASRQLAKYGDLAMLAQQVGYGQARDVFVQAIEKQLDTWLNASDGDKFEFYYDKDWATLIGYPASYDSDDKLNDHHFHYGYIINAAATIAQFDPAWAAQSQYGAMINQLIADVANWNRNDPTYTYLRNFDPYAGHSWADGTGQGNNEESASEALNFAASVARWGAVTGQQDIQNLGLYLHTTESEAMAQYWFDVDHAVFPDGYAPAQNGRVFGDGADYATFFGTNPNWVQGINLTPINGGSLFLALNPEEIREDLKYLSDKNGTDGPTDWKLSFWMYQALADPEAALTAYMADPNWKSGGGEESKVYTLNWLQTLAAMGTIDAKVTADSPFAAAFVKNGIHTYVAFNPSGGDATITFSDGKSIKLGSETLVTVAGDGSVTTVDYHDSTSIPQRPDGIPLDLPTDPPEFKLDQVAVNGDLSLYVEETTGIAWIKVGTADPRALLNGANRALLTTPDNLTFSGIGRNADGSLELLGTKTDNPNLNYAFGLDAKFHIGGNTAALYGDADWAKLEPWFGRDFNGDGIVVGGAPTLVAQNGSLKLLVDSGNGRAYMQDGTGPLTEIFRNAGGDPTLLTRGGSSLSAIGKDADGHIRVLDMNVGSDTSYAWQLDAKGNWTREDVFNADNALTGEAIFQKDLNGDGAIAPPLDQVVATSGSLKLLVDPATGYALIQLEDGSKITITRDGFGDAVKLDHGSKLFAVGRDDQGRLRVLDGDANDKSAGSTHWAWILDSTGKYVDQTVYSGDQLADAEKIFQQDLNGDGQITGVAHKVVDQHGGDTLSVDPITGKAYVSVNGAPDIQVTRDGDGWGDVQLQRGDWGLVAVATDGEGRTRVLDADPFSDMKYAWILDANGHWSGEQSFDASTIGQAETLFGKDLDGNGTIGNKASVVSASSSHSIMV